MKYPQTVCIQFGDIGRIVLFAESGTTNRHREVTRSRKIGQYGCRRAIAQSAVPQRGTCGPLHIFQPHHICELQ